MLMVERVERVEEVKKIEEEEEEEEEERIVMVVKRGNLLKKRVTKMLFHTLHRIIMRILMPKILMKNRPQEKKAIIKI